MWEVIAKFCNTLGVKNTENERRDRNFCTHTHVSVCVELEEMPVLVIVGLTKPTNAETQGKRIWAILAGVGSLLHNVAVNLTFH